MPLDISNFAKDQDDLGTQMPGTVSGTSILSLGSFNGTTDGTRINALLTQLGGPGTVFLPNGTAGIDTTILLGPGQALFGTGWGTVLQAKAGLNGDVVAPATVNSAGAFVVNLVVDGNKAANASGNGIHWDMTGNTLSTSQASNGVTLRDLYVRNCAQDGVFTRNTTNGIVNVGQNVQSYWNAGNGFNVQSSDSFWTDCYAEKNGLAGWTIGPNAAHTGLVNCRGDDSGQVTPSAGYGFKITSGRCRLVGCDAQDNSLHGYFATTSGATNNVLAGCTADSSGFNNASANAAGFYVDTATAHTTISGCHAVDNFGGTYQAYGYYVAGTADFVQIDGTGSGNRIATFANPSTGTHNTVPVATKPTRGWNQPTGTLGASIFDRSTATNLTTATPGASGELFGALVPVQPADIISNVLFTSGSTAGATLTHQWAALYDTSGNLLGVSADNTGAAWAANTEQTFALTSPYTVPDGVTAVYAMVCVVGTTLPTFVGTGFLATGLNSAPQPAVNGNTGNTVPASASNPASLSASTKMPYARLT